MQLLSNTHWYIWPKIQGEPPLNSRKTKTKKKTKNKNKNKNKKKHFNLLYIMTAIFVDNKIYN